MPSVFGFARIVFAVLFVAFAASTSLRAQTFTQDLDRAWSSYSQGKYAEALEQFNNFVRIYENDPQFAEVNPRVRYLIALALVRLGRWNEVIAAVDASERAPGKREDAWADELTFWKGVALLRTGQPAEARKVFEGYLTRYGNSPKAATARMLLALSMIQAEQWADAAKLLQSLRRSASGVMWGRYLLLETLARTNAGELDAALALVDEGHRNWRRMAQITAFELLAVQLAEKLLEEEDKSKAILCLIRIQSRDELLKLQDEQIAQLERYLAALEKRDPDGVETLMTHGLVEQVKKERENFEAIPNFDSSVRFRMAQAFLDQGRYRETAYVLENMLDELPPDQIVEQGTETLVQCYVEIGRWDKVIEVADKFLEKYPQSEGVPRVLIQKGLALQENNQLAEAEKVFDEFLDKYPSSDLAGNASFLRGFNSILEERFDVAEKRFKETLEKYPNSPIAENALFWIAQAESMGRQHDLAVPAYEAYLKKYPKGQFATEAKYRHAFSLYGLKDYEKAIPELTAFIEENPNDPNSSEARLLLGDAYFARNEYQKAIDTLMAVPKAGDGYREEAFFKVAKYYKLAEEPKNLRDLMAKFQNEFPESARLAEAVYTEGASYAGEPEKQTEIFTTAIDRFGDDPQQWGVADMMAELVKLGRTNGTEAEVVRKFTELRDTAKSKGRRAMELNASWGLATALRDSDPAAADQALFAAAPLLKLDVDNPRIAFEIADAFQRTGQTGEAVKIYKEIRRWNPVSPLNQNVFANLGLIAFNEGNFDDARMWFRRYFEETPGFVQLGLVSLKSAELERKAGNLDRAIELYDNVLREKKVGRREKAEALLALGEIQLERKKPDLAVPYLQRIYILYGAFPDLVAQAYLLSGKAFEELKDRLAAARTYVEMLNNPDITEEKFSAERAEAKKRLDALPADVRSQAEAAWKAEEESLKQKGA